MSSSSGLAAAKRRRGGTQQNVQQEEQLQQQQPTGALTVPQSIYLLSNRITTLENQLIQSVSYLEDQLTQKATDNSVTVLVSTLLVNFIYPFTSILCGDFINSSMGSCSCWND